MAFRRGVWRCHVQGCGDDAALAFAVLVSTPGARQYRIQKLTNTVRLCMADARGLAGGKLPGALKDVIRETIEKVTGVECKPNTKPKR